MEKKEEKKELKTGGGVKVVISKNRDKSKLKEKMIFH